MDRLSNIDKLILGTAQLGLDYGINNERGQPSKAEALELLAFARSAGITRLDTSPHYGSAQELIGKFHDGRDDKFRIISKFIGERLEGSIEEEVHGQLGRLGVEALDTMLFHRMGELKNGHANLESLLELQSSGYIKSLGVSIYTATELEQVIDMDFIQVVQVPFNLLDHDKEIFLRELASSGKEVHARSVFLQGLFFKSQGDFSEQLRPMQRYVQQLADISEENKISMAELALSFVASKNFLDGVLIGAERISQLETNIYAFRSGLPDKVLERIGGIEVKEKELLNPTTWK